MTPDEALALVRSLPIYSVPVAIAHRDLSGYGFDWEKQQDGTALLLYRSLDDITPMHVVTDYARAVFDRYGGTRRAEWAALADRAIWTVNPAYSDRYGEAFGAACAVLFSGGPVPLLSFFKTQGLADDVRSFALSLVPVGGSDAPTIVVAPAGPGAAEAGMPRTMYDSTNPEDIPVDARMVAGYIDGWYRWPDDSWDRFPYAVKVRIAIHPATRGAHVLDVEWGAASPEDVPGWTVMSRADGIDPTAYVNRSNWQECRDACDAAGVAYPHWWVAAYGIGAVLLDGTVATQYANEDITGAHYDLSAVAPFWPGVDEEGDVAFKDDPDAQAFVKDVHDTLEAIKARLSEDAHHTHKTGEPEAA